MAAVRVTAATCNQQQQIQKHVPPIEAKDSRIIYFLFSPLFYIIPSYISVTK